MSDQKYAISEWHNTAEIYRKLDELISQPPHIIKREKIE